MDDKIAARIAELETEVVKLDQIIQQAQIQLQQANTKKVAVIGGILELKALLEGNKMSEEKDKPER